MANEKNIGGRCQTDFRAKKPPGIGQNRRCTDFMPLNHSIQKEFGFIEVVNVGIAEIDRHAGAEVGVGSTGRVHAVRRRADFDRAPMLADDLAGER